MISSQRIIFMFILINILIGIGIGIYKNPTAYDSSIIDEEIQIMEDQQVEFEEENTEWGGIPTTDTSGEGKTIGNPLKMGAIVWNMFLDAIAPWSIHPWMFNNTVEKIIAWLLMLFRAIGTSLLIFETILVFKNKKAT